MSNSGHAARVAGMAERQMSDGIQIRPGGRARQHSVRFLWASGPCQTASLGCVGCKGVQGRLLSWARCMGGCMGNRDGGVRR